MTQLPNTASPADAGAVVVDASVAVKLFVQEPLRAQAQAVFDRLADSEPLVLHVPDLFFGECANVLWKYVRRHGYDAETALRNLADLVALGLIVTPTSALVTAAFPLAVDEAITAYDALYVALADRLDCPLITADERLVDRVRERHPNIAWLGDYSPAEG